MFFISGIQRSGSNLLSSILCQNKEIHIEGKSALLQLMWDAEKSCMGDSRPFLLANKKGKFIHSYISSIPNIYYENCKRNIVLDKNPHWIDENNFHLIQKYISNNPKIIVLTRKTEEVIASMINVYKKNNLVLSEEEFFINSGALIDQVSAIHWAKTNLKEYCLFIDYEEILQNASGVVEKISLFLSLKKFDYIYENIRAYAIENDEFYGINGLHHVRPQIKKDNYEIKLSQKTLERCQRLNEKMYGDII